MNKLAYPYHRINASRADLLEYIDELEAAIQHWADEIGYAEGILFLDGVLEKDLIETIIERGA